MSPSQANFNESYERLGLMPGASLNEIKQAYRRLAKSAHPDLNPDRGDDFMAHLNRAYQTLSGRFKGGAAPYDFQEFSFAARPRPEPSKPEAKAEEKAETEAPEAKTGPAVPGFEVCVPGPAAANAVSLANAEKIHFGPLDIPLPEAVRSEAYRPAGPAVPPRPSNGYQLTGLDRKQGSLVYRLEITGSPEKAVLPVRTLHGCEQCGGSGMRPYGPGGLCPGCGGAGKIVKPKNTEVALPPNWEDGQLVEVQTSDGKGLVLELRRSPAMGRA